MKQKMSILFLVISFLIPVFDAMGDAPHDFLADSDIAILDEQLNHSLVLIDNNICKSIIELAQCIPHYEWSQEFRNLCQDIADEGTVAPYEYIAQVIDECLDVCKNLSSDHLCLLQSDLQEYKTKLHAGKAHLSFADEQATQRKIKKICKLCVGCLAVTGHLFVNGVEITGGAGATGATGPTGATGATGPAAVGAVTSTNVTACSDAVARFDGTATTVINNAPLRALDVSGIQSTSPLLADDCLTGTLNLALIPKGTGALIAAIPDGTATGGNARGARAVDLQMSRGSNTQVASGGNAVIAGGFNNTASGNFSAVGGGAVNRAIGVESTIGGGVSNLALGVMSTVGGGSNNIASGIGGSFTTSTGNSATTIGGGFDNIALFQYATIAGGAVNVATGLASMIPGGTNNRADGDYSFASGLDAHATHTGAFVWADSTGAPVGLVFTSTAVNQFRVRATGGAQFITNSLETTGVSLEPAGSSWGSISDRNRKENFKEVDTVEVLNKLMNIPILSWNYKGTDESIRHIGPMAQDFNPAFDFNEAPLSITTLDFDGVSLAAIQGLYRIYTQRMSYQDNRINDQDNKIEYLENIIKQLVSQQQIAH